MSEIAPLQIPTKSRTAPLREQAKTVPPPINREELLRWDRLLYRRVGVVAGIAAVI